MVLKCDVSAILAIAYLRILPHSIDHQILFLICLGKCRFLASVLWKALTAQMQKYQALCPFVAYCAHFQLPQFVSHFSSGIIFAETAHTFSQLSIQIRKRDKRLTLLFQFLRRSTLPICEQLASAAGLFMWLSRDCQGNHMHVRFAHFQTTQRRWHLTVDFSENTVLCIIFWTSKEIMFSENIQRIKNTILSHLRGKIDTIFRDKHSIQSYFRFNAGQFVNLHLRVFFKSSRILSQKRSLRYCQA